MNKALAVLQELKECASYWGEYDVPIGIHERIGEAIGELLAQPEQEPVVLQYRTKPNWTGNWSKWEDCRKESYEDYIRVPLLHDWTYETRELYTAPPKREQEWQGLTEDEIVEILDTTHFNEDKFCFLEACINYCCAIQAKLKRKNTLTEIKKPLAQPEQEAVEDRIARWHKLGYEQGKKASKREPLSEDQVSELLMSGFSTHLMDLVRIIEKAHGIGECNSHYKERHETFGEEV